MQSQTESPAIGPKPDPAVGPVRRCLKPETPSAQIDQLAVHGGVATGFGRAPGGQFTRPGCPPFHAPAGAIHSPIPITLAVDEGADRRGLP